MNGPISKLARCAIYTRKSTEYNLELAFNSLDAQREACEAYIKSQAHEGWRLIPGRYDDGAFSGASLERPALQRLLADVRAGTIDIVLVYKVDRLTRSLADFAKLIELFDAHGVSFVSVTQSFNTSSSMGRLTLNVLLSFAQFERELIGERVRDKIAASKRKGHTSWGVIKAMLLALVNGGIPISQGLAVVEPAANLKNITWQIATKLKAEGEGSRHRMIANWMTHCLRLERCDCEDIARPSTSQPQTLQILFVLGVAVRFRGCHFLQCN